MIANNGAFNKVFYYVQLICDQKLMLHSGIPHVMRVFWSELCYVGAAVWIPFVFSFWRCIVVPVYLWFLFFVQMVQDCVWCTHVECIRSKWPTSHLPTYQHLTFRFVSDTRSWCCLVLQDTVMWPHMCVHLYTCDCNSVNVFWVRIHSRFWSEYKIAPIVCQINYSKVWKYNVINSYFGFENCADLVKLLIQSIIFCPGWWEHCPELQIPELGWSSIWVDQVWPVGQISTELTISANSKWRKHAFFANICAIKHMGEEEKQVKL